MPLYKVAVTKAASATALVVLSRIVRPAIRVTDYWLLLPAVGNHRRKSDARAPEGKFRRCQALSATARFGSFHGHCLRDLLWPWTHRVSKSYRCSGDTRLLSRQLRDPTDPRSCSTVAHRLPQECHFDAVLRASTRPSEGTSDAHDA